MTGPTWRLKLQTCTCKSLPLISPQNTSNPSDYLSLPISYIPRNPIGRDLSAFNVTNWEGIQGFSGMMFLGLVESIKCHCWGVRAKIQHGNDVCFQFPLHSSCSSIYRSLFYIISIYVYSSALYVLTNRIKGEPWRTQKEQMTKIH